MSKVRDVLVIFLVAVFVSIVGVQATARADYPSPTDATRVSVNTCKVSELEKYKYVRGRVVNSNPLVFGRAPDLTLWGDVRIQCSRNYNTTHNRVFAVVQIQKWKSQYKKWMGYRQYAYNYNWPKGVGFEQHPAARIRCDGHGIYRVEVRTFTGEAGAFAKSFPSNMIVRQSKPITTCIGTRTMPLHQVNNP